MEPTKLTLSNFLSYRDDSIDLDPVACAALVGDNGAGKSSLLDALTWALYGQGTKGGARDLDNYVTRGEAEARVDLEFRLQGQMYRVVRARNAAKGKSVLELFVLDDGWRALSGKTITETQATIEQTLRMDYRTFTSSALVLQGQSDSFTAAMTDAERKDALGRILGLDIWDKLQERAREKCRGLKSQLQGYEQTRTRLQETLERKAELAARHDQLAALIGAKTREIEPLTQAVLGLEAQIRQKPALEQAIADVRREVLQQQNELQSLHASHERTEQQVFQMEHQIEAAQGILSRAAEIEAAVEMAEAIQDDVTTYDTRAREYMRLSGELQSQRTQAAQWDRTREAELARLAAGIRSAMEQAAVLGKVPCGENEKAACPLLGLARRAAEQAETATTRLAKLQAESNPYAGTVAQIESQIAALGYDPAAHDAARAALADVRSVANLQPQLQAAETRVGELRARIAETRNALADLEARRTDLTARLAATRERGQALEQELRDLAPIAQTVAQRQAELAQARQEEAGLRTEIGRVEAAYEQVGKAEIELAALEGQTKALTEELAIYELLDQACGRKGVPALIIENAVPEIERLANDMLSRMAGGRLAVQLDTQIEGKTTGTVQEVLRVTVLEEGAERPYQTYSGAERFMVDLALRVALSKFLAHRAGAEIRLFVLDEGLGACDQTNRQAVMDAIGAVAQEFAKVLVITHIAELQDSFPQQIVVTKGDGGSKTRLVA